MPLVVLALAHSLAKGKRPLNPGDQTCEVRITFQDDSETLLVTPTGQNLYRMEESSALGEVNYRKLSPNPRAYRRCLIEPWPWVATGKEYSAAV
jgi:hypothetical protein